MGVGDWDLIRNKMFFSSCSLFVILVFGIHLMPFFPSVSSFLSPSAEIISASTVYKEKSPLHRDTCISFLHSVTYQDAIKCETNVFGNYRCKKKSWKWPIIELGSRIDECEFHKLKKSDASVFLKESWLVVVGDSQSRLFYASLLELLAESKEIEKIKKEFHMHANYSTTVHDKGIKLDFVWAPFIRNLTRFMSHLKKNNKYPNVMVMGAGLWDMLHVTDAKDFHHCLKAFKNSSSTLLGSDDGGLKEAKSSSTSNLSLHIFWVGMPTLINSKLNTVAKRERLNDVMYKLYDDVLSGSKVLSGSGGPFFRLDLRLLSDLCGSECTIDGMHYDAAVYDTAVQIMLNSLLIQSNKKLQI